MSEKQGTEIQQFIDRWQKSGAAERANYQLFLTELCDIIGVQHPQPASESPHENSYVFEKRVPSPHGTTKFIDLYKRGHFVLEAKQGSKKATTDRPLFSEAELTRQKQRKIGTAIRGTKAWDTAMEKARQQAQNYARSLPNDEITDGRPPFIIVVDVGNTIALFSEFSRTGGNYIPFPDPNRYRLKLSDLHKAETRHTLRQVWQDPMSLDPSQRSAKVTRKIAARLAELAKSLEKDTDAETVAQFLMRCIFTMFAEDVGLLPERSFTQLLDDIQRDSNSFKPMLEHLWQTMNKGGFSVILRRQIPKFNGGLFADQTALALTQPQLELLIEAARADWRDVEPAIFGTLVERALNPVDRHKLGAHYTPRAYVERLVKPTIIEPLRAEWESVQAAALLYAEAGQIQDAFNEVDAFHQRLASIRILDPACGTGNFLYVTLEHLKRLEGEVLNTLHELGKGQMKLEMTSVTVSPEQFLGLEVNPRAAAIAELVLWIGYLQWHYRAHGTAPHNEPIIKDYHNIECRDAVLAWDAVEPLLDDDGQPVTRWDGRTTKPHPVTGQEVPDETARIPAYHYINPRPAEWPQADFVVGNPPFIGNKRMRFNLGDGYTETLRKTYKKLPATIDLVMYWWEKAANLAVQNKIQRFGFITTNSVTQPFNRIVLAPYLNDHKKPLSLMFAISDHPWVDSADGAAVRIAMTVAEAGSSEGILVDVISEKENDSDNIEIELIKIKGKILPDLRIGPDIHNTVQLQSNSCLSGQGVIVLGEGFMLNDEEYDELLKTEPSSLRFIKSYRNGSDLMRRSRGLRIIDLHGLSEGDLKGYPVVYQRIYNRVRPKRLEMKDKARREKWWLFGRSNQEIRNAIEGLDRYIATCRTAKHRVFLFLDGNILPDAKIVAIGLSDPYHLGVLSSKIHVTWAMASGAWLGVGNDSNYNHSICFGKFTFPDATDDHKTRIRDLAEQLDAHRKRQQAQHPTLTLTDLYNVLEKERAGEPLTAKDKTIHQQGLVSILKQLHDDLDDAVCAAYGWPPDLSDDDILQRLVDLNAERAAEEANGMIRWLRPDYQAPDRVRHQQTSLAGMEEPSAVKQTIVDKWDWPDSLKDRATAVRSILALFDEPVDVKTVAAGFEGKRTQKRLDAVGDILEMLAELGQIREENGQYSTN